MKEFSHNRQEEVGQMFDDIAYRYDFLNHFLSFGIDRLWRRKAVKTLPKQFDSPAIIDIATGTGDLAIEAMSLEPCRISGLDISEKMLDLAAGKIKKRGYSEKIELLKGSSESIPFSDRIFDIAMVAFGVRNFSDPLKGLSEMGRVLKKGGVIMVLEFSKPSLFMLKHLYVFYFLNVLPLIGRLFSGHRKAYRYLPESVLQFPEGDSFLELMRKAGFRELKKKPLSGGIATVYTGMK